MVRFEERIERTDLRNRGGCYVFAVFFTLDYF